MTSCELITILNDLKQKTMPVNKNALLRYQILDRCFSDFHRKYEIEDLLDKVNEALYDLYGTEVSIRQIRDDIKTITRYYADPAQPNIGAMRILDLL